MIAGPYFAGAQEAAPERWPWVTAIVDASIPGAEGTIAAGALVHPKFVLVAAHSVAGKTPAELQCVIGEHLLGEASARRDVVDIVIHPDYELDRFQIQHADVALLRLKEAESAITPVALLESLDPHASAEPLLTTVIGWGATSAAGTVEPFRQELVLPTVSLETANARLSYNTLLKASHVPIGTALMEADACLAGSSAPVVVTTPAGDQVAGLVSFSKGCQVPSWYRVCTNVHYFSRWIGSTLWPEYAAWEALHGGEGFFHDRNGDGVPNGAEYGLGYDVVSAGRIRAGEWRFPSERADVSRRAEVSGDLRLWMETEPTARTEGEWTVWQVMPGNPGDKLSFSRIAVQRGQIYVPTPKTLAFMKDFAGEMIGPDERTPDNRFVRAYMLADLPPAGKAGLRFEPRNFDGVVRLRRANTGEVIAEKSGNAGEALTLVFVAPSGEEVVAEIEADGLPGYGEFGLAVTGAPDPRISPMSFTEVLNSPTKTVAVNITNAGDGVFDYTATSGAAWAQLDVSAGSLASRQTAMLRITLNATNLGVGDYETAVEIAGNDGTLVSIPISMCVLPNYPTINQGQTVAELTANDPPSLHRSDLFFGVTLTMDAYLFTAPATGRYGITMASGAFDCYLYVMDAKTGNLLAEADDSGNGHRFNAAISIDLERGQTYLIEATTYGPWTGQNVNITGPYQVIIIH